MSAPQQTPDRMRCAVTAAEVGSRWWDLAVSTQRAKSGPAVEDGDLVGLAGEMVATLRALEELAGLLAWQTAGFGEGRVLRDDAGADPMERLEEAGAAAYGLAVALRVADTFRSAIEHIEVGPDPDPATSSASNDEHRHGGGTGVGPGAGGGWSR